MRKKRMPRTKDRKRARARTFDVLAFKRFWCTQMQSIKQTEINFSHKMQFAINWDSVIEKLRIKPLIDKAIEFVHCYFCNSSSSSKQPAAPTTNTHTPILIILLKLDRRLKWRIIFTVIARIIQNKLSSLWWMFKYPVSINAIKMLLSVRLTNNMVPVAPFPFQKAQHVPNKKYNSSNWQINLVVCLSTLIDFIVVWNEFYFLQ